MVKRVAIVCCLVAACVLLLWSTFDTEPEERFPDDTPVSSEERPALEGQGDVETAETDEEPPKTEPEPVGDGRRWVLEVELRAIAASSIAFPSGMRDASGTGASPFEGEAVRVELHRGTDRRVLARGNVDARGQARFDVPILGTMSSLARASSQVRVIPESTKLQMSLGARRGLGRIGSPSVEYVVPPARPLGDVVTLRVVVPVLREAVTGRVITADGEPIPDAHVATYSSDGGRASEACTDADGRFAVVVTKPGTFRVSVWAPDGAYVTRGNIPLVVGADEDLGDFRVAYEKAFGGRVTYPDGKPVRGLRISSSYTPLNMHVNYGFQSLTCETHGIHYFATTDADGRFRVSGGESNKNGLWRLRGEFEGNAGYERPDDDVYPKKVRNDLDAVLNGHRIRFQVVDHEGGAVSRAELVLQRLDAPKNAKRKPRPVRMETGFDGRADAWLLPGSRWTASVIAKGAVPFQKEIVVPSSGNESNADLRLQSLDLDAGLRFFLEGSHGKSVFPAVIRVETDDGHDVWNRRAENAGFFVALAPGVYRIRIWSVEPASWCRGRYRWMPFEDEVTVEPRKKGEVRGQVSEAAHLELTLKFPDGVEEMNYVRATIQHADTGRKRQELIRTNPWGERVSTEVVGAELESGTWEVHIEERAFKPVTRSIELRSGELTMLEVRMERQ